MGISFDLGAFSLPHDYVVEGSHWLISANQVGLVLFPVTGRRHGEVIKFWSPKHSDERILGKVCLKKTQEELAHFLCP